MSLIYSLANMDLVDIAIAINCLNLENTLGMHSLDNVVESPMLRMHHFRAYLYPAFFYVVSLEYRNNYKSWSQKKVVVDPCNEN